MVDSKKINYINHQIEQQLKIINMKEKPFERLVGNRVFLEIPKIPESKILLAEEAQKKWVEEQRLALNKFIIYAVGDTVTGFKEGDIVDVDKRALAQATVVQLEKDLEVLQVSVFDIGLVWKSL